jgi:hypothetical protein
MRLRGLARFATALVVVVCGACASFDSSDAPASAADAGAAPDASAADAGTVAGNLATNGTFEELGCAGWLGDGIQATPDPKARSGTGACRLCGNGGRFATVLNRVDTPVPQGARFRATLWALAAPAPDQVAASQALARLDVIDADGRAVSVGQASQLSASPSWQPLLSGVPAGDGGAGLRFLVDLKPTNACVIVDDLVVERLP